MSSVSIEQLLEQLAEERAFDLRAYKRSTLERRLKKRMGEVGVRDYSSYMEHVRANSDEVNALLNTVLINITEFFRDPQAWEYLRQKVLPSLLRERKAGDGFRGWCAGCATGEEVYSLAILIAELLGNKLPEFDVRIYATDIDEDALNIARRAEYPADKLRRLRPEWRNKYFLQCRTIYRVSREIRRMVVFGRSNLAHDAPISHVNLIICRNVLIYFGAEAQRQILSRLHYALEKDGVVFFGKAESQLTNSQLFVPLNSRWRIFRRAEDAVPRTLRRRESEEDLMTPRESHDEELELLRLQQRYLLDTLGSGVIALDSDDIIHTINEFALNAWAVEGQSLVGKPIQKSELGKRHPELLEHLESTRGGKDVRFRAQIKNNSDDERVLSVVIKPITSNGDRKGTLIHCEDVTHREKLQATIEQLEATGEELQSANEELETTNEELQSTNEELETTNEELQSTNEELETTNEELQSLNEELENMNEELGTRTRELDALNLRYSDTLERMPWAVMVVDGSANIQFWNSAAERLFKIAAKSVVGIQLGMIPIESELRKILVRGTHRVIDTQKPTIIRNGSMGNGRSVGTFEIRFEPLTREGSPSGVLIMFGPMYQERSAPSMTRGGSSRRAAKGSQRATKLKGRAKREKKNRK